MYYRQQNGNHARKQVALEHIRHKTESGDIRRAHQYDKPVPTKCKILIFDTETSPEISLPWGSMKQYINPEQLLAPSMVMCWAARWLGKKKVMFEKMDVPSGVMPSDPIKQLLKIAKFYAYTDYPLCEGLWKLFDEADIVIAHNGKAFDTAHMNTRWLDHGLPTPSPYKIIDTLITAKKRFRFPRNKLESICRYRNIGKKIEHEGFELWKKCMCGDVKAWSRMKKYNIGDVDLLHDVYLDFRPWIFNHPNVALHYEDGLRRCVVCGSTAMTLLKSTASTAASVFDAYRCESCGNVMRSRNRHDPIADIEDRMANVRN